MKKILIATTNVGKIQEIKKYLLDLPFQLVTLSELKITEKAPEDFPTFQENSINKALFYHKISSLPTISDDGGLEIDSLGGKPGVYSRRWMNGSEDVTDLDLINFTLKKLEGVKIEKRTARLKTVLSFVNSYSKVFTADGAVEGVIAEKSFEVVIPGFPYRSLLFLPKIKKYYHDDDMTQKELDEYNHRKKALEKIKAHILKEIGLKTEK